MMPSLGLHIDLDQLEEPTPYFTPVAHRSHLSFNGHGPSSSSVKCPSEEMFIPGQPHGHTYPTGLEETLAPVSQTQGPL
jgi:hypothetical protein